MLCLQVLTRCNVSHPCCLHEQTNLTALSLTHKHRAKLNDDGNMINKPSYGDGCQYKPQCSDNDDLRTPDSAYGFFATAWYGLVYSPQKQSGVTAVMGCGICPEHVGNKFISMVGAFQDINKALSKVIYLPDPHFNTRYGMKENILFEVSDDGAIGNDASAPALTDSLSINVIVESVNDRPIVGRRVKLTREINYFDGGKTSPRFVQDNAFLKIDKSLDRTCFGLAPAGDMYQATCNTSVRQYIDIDEDTVFMITPDVLWIEDVDSDEATKMVDQARRRYCCEPAGELACRCGSACLCGTRPCSGCSAPRVCQGGAGQLLVDFQACCVSSFACAAAPSLLNYSRTVHVS
jgi:hypothetical protein